MYLGRYRQSFIIPDDLETLPEEATASADAGRPVGDPVGGPVGTLGGDLAIDSIKSSRNRETVVAFF